MSDHDTRNLLDDATAALRDVPVPDGPPAEVLAATVGAIDHRLAGAAPAGRPRRKRIMRYVGYGTVTAAAVAIAILVGLGGRSAEAHVRRAMDNAAKAKSVRLVFTREYDGKTEPLITIHMQDGRSRREDRRGGGNRTLIVDTTARQDLVLNHADKTARRETLAGESLKNAVQQHEVFFDPLTVVRGIKEMTVKELDGEKLDGRPMKVFMLSHPGNDEHAAMTAVLWIDEKTDLPARLKLLNDGVVPEDPRRPFVKADTVITFEAWNKEFDPKLFKLDVPAGYKEIEGSGAAPAAPLRIFFTRVLDNAAKARSVKVTAMLINVDIQGKMTHVQTMFRQGDMLRIETACFLPGLPDKPVTVADLKTRKSLLLLPQLKTAQRGTLGVEESQGVAGLMDNFAAMKAQLTGGDDKAVKAVGEEQIGGRRTKAYEITVTDSKVAHPGVWTVWVDPETELPVRLADAQRALILNFEDWNKEFDPALFRLDVPAGYKLIEGPKEPEESGPTGRP
jgi:hypothetical protein